MSSSDRRSLVLSLAALPLLAACGFAPVHGTGGGGGGGNTASRLRGKVSVLPVDGRAGFALTGRLEERLGRARASAPYELTVTLNMREDDVGLSSDNEIDRFNVIGTAHYQVRHVGTGQPVASGVADNFTSYSATTGTVGTLGARRDAQERLVRSLADQIVTRLMASAPDWQS